MDANYWHDRWATERTGWHKDAPNELLARHFSTLSQPAGAQVFVPLCGKTRDIGWLLDQGYRVSGVELNESAVRQLFSELGVNPQTDSVGELKRYTSPGCRIFVGDIFSLTAGQLGSVDACFDRAALVALPPDTRARYTTHLLSLIGAAPQLLITLTYDQSQVDGPPHSVPLAEIQTHYDSRYHIQSLSELTIDGGFRGLTDATEHVWKLTPH